MRPDKNKGARAAGPGPAGTSGRSDLPAALHVLERDLDRLLVFLDSYERSSHPARIEALRWLQPALERHLSTLNSQRQMAAGREKT